MVDKFSGPVMSGTSEKSFRETGKTKRLVRGPVRPSTDEKAFRETGVSKKRKSSGVKTTGSQAGPTRKDFEAEQKRIKESKQRETLRREKISAGRISGQVTRQDVGQFKAPVSIQDVRRPEKKFEIKQFDAESFERKGGLQTITGATVVALGGLAKSFTPGGGIDKEVRLREAIGGTGGERPGRAESFVQQFEGVGKFSSGDIIAQPQFGTQLTGGPTGGISFKELRRKELRESKIQVELIKGEARFSGQQRFDIGATGITAGIESEVSIDVANIQKRLSSGDITRKQAIKERGQIIQIAESKQTRQLGELGGVITSDIGKEFGGRLSKASKRLGVEEKGFKDIFAETGIQKGVRGGIIAADIGLLVGAGAISGGAGAAVGVGGALLKAGEIESRRLRGGKGATGLEQFDILTRGAIGSASFGRGLKGLDVSIAKGELAALEKSPVQFGQVVFKGDDASLGILRGTQKSGKLTREFDISGKILKESDRVSLIPGAEGIVTTRGQFGRVIGGGREPSKIIASQTFEVGSRSTGGQVDDLLVSLSRSVVRPQASTSVIFKGGFGEKEAVRLGRSLKLGGKEEIGFGLAKAKKIGKTDDFTGFIAKSGRLKESGGRITGDIKDIGLIGVTEKDLGITGFEKAGFGFTGGRTKTPFPGSTQALKQLDILATGEAAAGSKALSIQLPKSSAGIGTGLPGLISPGRVRAKLKSPKATQEQQFIPRLDTRQDIGVGLGLDQKISPSVRQRSRQFDIISQKQESITDTKSLSRVDTQSRSQTRQASSTGLDLSFEQIVPLAQPPIPSFDIGFGTGFGSGLGLPIPRRPIAEKVGKKRITKGKKKRQTRVAPSLTGVASFDFGGITGDLPGGTGALGVLPGQTRFVQIRKKSKNK